MQRAVGRGGSTPGLLDNLSIPTRFLALAINGEITRQGMKIIASRRVKGCRTINTGGGVRTKNEIDWAFGTFFTAQSRDRRPRPHLAEASNDTNTNTNTTDDCMLYSYCKLLETSKGTVALCCTLGTQNTSHLRGRK